MTYGSTDQIPTRPPTLGEELLSRYIASTGPEGKRTIKMRFGLTFPEIEAVLEGKRRLIPDLIAYEDLNALAWQLSFGGDPYRLAEPRPTRRQQKPISREAYLEQQRQRRAKLGGRTHLTRSEQEEYAKAYSEGKLHKTTAEALTVYSEPEYELRHGVMNSSEYFIIWKRPSGMTDRAYLGKFASVEDALEAFGTWKKHHKA